ncbi:MAG: hypothetical protein OHK0017_08650 [Patescibacteria group bacterium]
MSSKSEAGQKTVLEGSQKNQLTLQHIDTSTPLTTEQITMVIEQNSKVYEYIHQERMKELEEAKVQSFDRRYGLSALLIFLAILAMGTLYFRSEYFDQVMALIIGLLGGGAGGYAFGKSSNKE